MTVTAPNGQTNNLKGHRAPLPLALSILTMTSAITITARP
jgi:hypothetical protein